jgi:heparosan-N-sulfate-glucuronate 5-epimerase
MDLPAVCESATQVPAELEAPRPRAILRSMRAGVIEHFFSKALWFPREVGPHVERDTIRGYYIDLREAATAQWPPPWLPRLKLYVGICQWGLGCYERYLAGEGEEWLASALGAGGFLLETQERGGASAGGWLHRHPYPHTFSLSPPWMSGIAQGQAASLLARLHLETTDSRYAIAARNAVKPLSISTENGGLLTPLDGGMFPEEFPTRPPSLVLNGGIYALWGEYDIWIGLGDADAGNRFKDGVETLARNLHRWDTGYWSRYDLYPHRTVNLASPWYHVLHICQLKVFDHLVPRPEFRDMGRRFEAYASSPVKSARAFAHKGFFRLRSPRRRRAKA